VRAFVAIELDARLREAMGERQALLRPTLGGSGWCGRGHPPHPAVPRRSVAGADRDAAARLAAAAAACPPCEARVAGLGMFPERGSPRVLWLGLDVPPPVVDLQATCERAARAAGFEREDRPFRAHLTLGRWRARAPRPELPRPISARRASRRSSSSGATSGRTAPSTLRSAASPWAPAVD